MNIRFSSELVACILLSACMKKVDEPKVAEPPKPKYTAATWKADFKEAFEASSIKTRNDGVSEFSACFKKTETKCDVFAFGKTDGFRKVSHFTPPGTSMASIAWPKSFFGLYVASLECKQPTIFIAPSYSAHNGWIFMKKAAVMADGEVILEQDFEHFNVDRDSNGGWVHEIVNWPLSDQQINALRQAAKAKSVILRITGSKGYTTMEKLYAEQFLEDANVVLYIYDALMGK